jgi:hypothetical protein
MRHMPDDTITVTLRRIPPLPCSETPPCPLEPGAGTIVSRQLSLAPSRLPIFIGEDAVLQRNSHGGNDTLVAKRA